VRTRPETHDATSGALRIASDDRGVHALRGVPGEWELFAATQSEAE
jgi:hypothetical protein